MDSVKTVFLAHVLAYQCISNEYNIRFILCNVFLRIILYLQNPTLPNWKFSRLSMDYMRQWLLDENCTAITDNILITISSLGKKYFEFWKRITTGGEYSEYIEIYGRWWENIQTKNARKN